jgi:hypothetical protein
MKLKTWLSLIFVSIFIFGFAKFFGKISANYLLHKNKPAITESKSIDNNPWILICTSAVKGKEDFREIKIIKKDPDVVRFWMKWVQDKKQVVEMSNIALNNNKKEMAVGYLNYSYSLILDECNCKNNTYQNLEMIDYDRDGHVIFQVSSEYLGVWKNVVPGTVIEKIFVQACK